MSECSGSPSTPPRWCDCASPDYCRDPTRRDCGLNLYGLPIVLSDEMPVDRIIVAPPEPSTPPTPETIRSHLEAIRAEVGYPTKLSRNSVQDLEAIESLLTDLICEYQEHAVAALDLLNRSAIYGGSGKDRELLISDPEGGAS